MCQILNALLYQIYTLHDTHQIGNLKIAPRRSFVRDEIHFLGADSADGDFPSPAPQFNIDNVFEYLVDARKIVSEHLLSQSVIRRIEFAVIFKKLLTLGIASKQLLTKVRSFIVTVLSRRLNIRLVLLQPLRHQLISQTEQVPTRI